MKSSTEDHSMYSPKMVHFCWQMEKTNNKAVLYLACTSMVWAHPCLREGTLRAVRPARKHTHTITDETLSSIRCGCGITQTFSETNSLSYLPYIVGVATPRLFWNSSEKVFVWAHPWHMVKGVYKPWVYWHKWSTSPWGFQGDLWQRLKEEWSLIRGCTITIQAKGIDETFQSPCHTQNFIMWLR